MNIVKSWLYKIFFKVPKKKFYKVFYFKIIPIFVLGFSVGVIAIWPGLISGNSRKCFFNILEDGSNGDIEFKTILTVKPSYLLKIRNARNKYLKVLLVGDSCFRNFWRFSFWLSSYFLFCASQKIYHLIFSKRTPKFFRFFRR